MRPLHRLFCVLACLAAVIPDPEARAQAPDTILINGKFVRYDAPPAEALAIGGDRIAALGNSAVIRALAGPGTRIIDLGGRTVIPGLIDSHIHAIRAGLTFTTEVQWIGVRTLADALKAISDKAALTPKGGWLVVAGGWTERQFAEDRLPTQAEIIAAAPDHHVFVQLFYSRVLLSPGGYEALGVAGDPELARSVAVERDAAGKPTGWVKGDVRTVSRLFDLLPPPSFAQKMEGTRAFFRALNSVGLTGVLDPGGYNMPVSDYPPLFEVWREGGLTLRVRYSLCAPRRGYEIEDFEALTQLLPMGFGDDWLRFNGIGENVTWGMYNNDRPTQAQKDELFKTLRWASERRMTATFHWNSDRSAPHLLDVLERVNAQAPIAPLRWSIAHLHDASAPTLARMHAIGIGWLMQNGLYFRGEALLGERGLDVARLAPPIGTALRMGLRVGAGTDAHRVMWYSPFVSLQWMVDGTTITGTRLRAEEETPTRIEALRLYTQDSAWFSFEEGSRGALAVGKLADLAVLSDDYLTVPTEEIGRIKSVLTIVGGRAVYATDAFAALEQKPR